MFLEATGLIYDVTTTTLSKENNSEKNHGSGPDYIGEILLQWDSAKDKARMGLLDDMNYGINNIRQLAKQKNLGVEESYFGSIIKDGYANWAKDAVYYAKRSAENGLVDDARMYLTAAVKSADYFDLDLPDQEMKDIMRTAYKNGAEKEMRESADYAKSGNIQLAVQCLNDAEYYSDEMLNCQRALRDIKPSFVDKLFYRRRYGKMDDDDIQSMFDSVGRKYDEETWWDSRRKKRDIYDIRVKLFKQMVKPNSVKPRHSYKLPSLPKRFGHFHYKKTDLSEKSKIIETSPKSQETTVKIQLPPQEAKPQAAKPSRKAFGRRIHDYVSNSRMYRILNS